MADPPGGGPDDGHDGASTALRDLVEQRLSEAAATLTATDQAIRRIQQTCSALSVEMAAVGQAVSDQVGEHASATAESLRAGIQMLSDDLEGVGSSVADSLAQVTARLGAANGAVVADGGPAVEGLADLVEGTAEGVARIETLVEALVEVGEARPADVTEQAARTLERLGLTVGARFEAATTVAVETVDENVKEAIDRAVSQFKDVSPPVVDRSTTAAITRLEERVAALTRQRDEHDRETKAILNGLEETVHRLASAQAEDLERVLDTIESTTTESTTTGAPRPDAASEADRLARIEASLAALAESPGQTQALVDVVAQHFEAFNKQLDALRRRLPLRARAAPPILDDRAMAALAALISEQIRNGAEVAATPATAAAHPSTARRPAKANPAPRPTRASKATSRSQTGAGAGRGRPPAP